MSFIIASVNVNGIRAACKQRNEENPGMNAWLAATPADVVLLQEVRASPAETEKALAPALADGWHLVQTEAAAKGRAGVGILSRTPLTDVEVGFGDFLDSGRYLAATTSGVRVASLYLPSGDAGTAKQDEKYTFLDQFAGVLDSLAATHADAVIGGDWNICHRAQDLKNNQANEKKSGHLPEERAFMDYVFGTFPEEEPQEKKGLGQWLGVVDYTTRTDWVQRSLDRAAQRSLDRAAQGAAAPDWYDVARRLAPAEEGPYTWWTYRGQAFNNDAGWRIDYQAATKSMLERARRAWVDKAATVEQRWSDHAPLLVEYAR